MQATTRNRYILRAATLVVTALVLVVVVRALRRDGPAALEAWRAARVRWGWVVAAAGCGLLAPAATSVGWRRLLTDMGLPVDYGWVLRLTLVSNIGRYLPGGKAWQLGIVAMMSAERGLPGPLVAGTSFLHGVVGLVVGAILLLPLGGAMIGGAGPLFALAAAGLAALLALPAVLRRMPRLRLLLARRINGIDTVSTATLWSLMWTAAAAWLASGGMLYSLAWALLPSPGAPPSLYAVAWIGPFLAGLLAVFSPAGIGVRDGAMQATLVAAGVASSSALLLVIVSRIFSTLVELIPACVLLVLGQLASRRDGAPVSGAPAERGVPADAGV